MCECSIYMWGSSLLVCGLILSTHTQHHLQMFTERITVLQHFIDHSTLIGYGHVTNSNYPQLCNRGYAFGLWLSLSVHTFWAICEIKALSRAHVAPESTLIVLRTKNSLYMLDDYSNNAEAIKTALSSRVCMRKDCADCGWPWPSLWPSWPNGSGNRNRDLGKSWAKFSYLT